MDIDKIILNFIWKFTDLRISVTELKSNKKVGRLLNMLVWPII